MQKSKHYERVWFSSSVIAEGIQTFEKLLDQHKFKEPIYADLSVSRGDETWKFDTVPEFLAEYAKNPTSARVQAISLPSGPQFVLDGTNRTHNSNTRISIQAAARDFIETVCNVFELRAAEFQLSAPEQVPDPLQPLRIFIGHGRSQQWRDLKDHLQDKHGYEVEAYEVGARAGHAIRDILEDMMTNASFACLVLTGEDETSDGKLLARQNVVHEAGLFQGHLGFSRAIILLEEGTEEFSNIAGIQQIRFGKTNIKETFGEVLATLRREFPDRKS